MTRYVPLIFVTEIDTVFWNRTRYSVPTLENQFQMVKNEKDKLLTLKG